MSSTPSTPPVATKPKPSPFYKIGIILVIVAIVYGIVVAALHYGTAPSTSNMFAGHSLTHYASDNPLPLLVGLGGVIFIVGLALAFIGYPKQKPALNKSTQSTNTKKP